MKIRKIDSRNDLYGDFKWQIKMEVEKFIKAREWCTATWGPAVEYQWFDPYGEENGYTHWCFDTRQVKNSSKFKPAIYLQTDAELTLFKLRWC